LGFGLAETLKVLNTIMVGNSLSFLMVCNMTPSGWRFLSYDCQKLDRSAETEIRADYTSRHKSGIWQNFTMTTPKTLNMKIAINKLSFPLVVDSDAGFDNYGILKSGRGAGQILEDWTYR
jgi:hypothetical protein